MQLTRLAQINYAFGLEALPKHKTFVGNLWESVENLDEMQFGSFILFLPQVLAARRLPDRNVPRGALGLWGTR